MMNSMSFVLSGTSPRGAAGSSSMVCPAAQVGSYMPVYPVVKPRRGAGWPETPGALSTYARLRMTRSRE